MCQDLKDLGLDYLDLDDIKNMKKEYFKKLIKKQLNDAALKYLLEGNESKSKLKDLKYYQLAIQPYLLSTDITTRSKKYLFMFRTRMTPVGYNYGRKVSCPICKTDAGDTQEHLFNCIILKISCPELYRIQDIKYEDIYSQSLQKLVKVAKICESVARKRAQLVS